MDSDKTAIFVDGAFFIKRAMRIFGRVEPDDLANKLWSYSLRHIYPMHDIKKSALKPDARDRRETADILLDEFGGRFHIFRVEELKVFDGSCEYLVYFNDSNREPPAVTNNIRIGSIGGHAKAIVGSQQQALIGISLDEIKTLVAERRELSEGDRLQLLQLIQAAEKLQQSGDSLQKGVFSKFSKLAERHGDIIGAIIQTFVPMLFGH